MSYSRWKTVARGWEKTYEDGNQQLVISIEKEALLKLLEQGDRGILKMRVDRSWDEQEREGWKWVALEKQDETKWVERLPTPEGL